MSKEHKILVQPLITEKFTRARENSNSYYFEVSPDANKTEVKKAVEKLFNVKVEKVNISNRKGKIKRVRMKAGKRKDTKRAIVRLKQEDTIKIFEGK
jgi:large subunit ribosomal protein L23